MCTRFPPLEGRLVLSAVEGSKHVGRGGAGKASPQQPERKSKRPPHSGRLVWGLFNDYSALSRMTSSVSLEVRANVASISSASSCSSTGMAA